MELADGHGQIRDLLIVDDAPGQSYIFERLLKTLGCPHRCHHAPGGPQALDFLRRSHPYESVPRPHLIILDIHMPGMAGCEVLHEIKSDPGLHSIPVIMFSHAEREDEISFCYRERANACIRRPNDYENTLRVVQAIEQFWFHVAQLPA